MMKSRGLLKKAAAALITAAAATAAEYSLAKGSYSLLRCLCDGSFFAAVIFAGIGLLMLIGRQGVFDGVRYIGHLILNAFTRLRGSRSESKSFPEYTAALREKDAGGKAAAELLICGGGMLAVSLVLLAVFYM